IEGAAAIRPWLQDFTLGWPRYGAAEVRAQIQATYDAGLSEWVLWNPSSRYTAEALAPKDGPAPSLPIPVHTRPVEVKLPEPRVWPLRVPAPAAPIAPVPVRPDSAGRRCGRAAPSARARSSRSRCRVATGSRSSSRGVRPRAGSSRGSVRGARPA